MSLAETILCKKNLKFVFFMILLLTLDFYAINLDMTASFFSLSSISFNRWLAFFPQTSNIFILVNTFLLAMIMSLIFNMNVTHCSFFLLDFELRNNILNSENDTINMKMKKIKHRSFHKIEPRCLENRSRSKTKYLFKIFQNCNKDCT